MSSLYIFTIKIAGKEMVKSLEADTEIDAFHQMYKKYKSFELLSLKRERGTNE